MADDPFRAELTAVADDLIAAIAFLTRIPARLLARGDIAKPDFGDPVEVRPGEIPVFWACGVTPQAAVMQARPPFAVTHKPGHMFLTDLRDVDLDGE